MLNILPACPVIRPVISLASYSGKAARMGQELKKEVSLPHIWCLSYLELPGFWRPETPMQEAERPETPMQEADG